MASVALGTGVFLVFSLQAGDWARASTPAIYYFVKMYCYNGSAPGFISACCPGP